MFIASIVLLTQASAPVLLQYAPSLGDRVVYELTQVFTDKQDGTVQTLQDRVTVKIVQRDSLGIVGAEWSILPVSESMDGQPIPLPKDLKPLVLKESRRANGAIHSRDEAPIDPVVAFRVARMATVVFANRPVRVGDSWKLNIKPEPGSDLPGVDAEYLLTKVTASDATVSLRYAENSGLLPLDARGEATLDLKSGWTLRLRLKVKNAVLPGGEGEPQDLDYQLEAKEAKIAGRSQPVDAGKAPSSVQPE